MTNYYFVGSYLPDLRIGLPAEISFQDFDHLLQMNLSKRDYEKTIVLRRLWDIQNFRSFLQKEPLDPHGEFDVAEMEEALLQTHRMRFYVREYLEKYESDEERLRHFPELLAAYFREEAKRADGFLKELLNFQREFLLVTVAFRAKKMGRDLSAELQFENPEEPFIAQLLAYKDAPTFEPPEKYEELKGVFEEHADAPLALHQALCEYVFDSIDRMVGWQPFTIDRILGYLVQLILVEKWLELDKAKGVEIVDRFVKEKA